MFVPLVATFMLMQSPREIRFEGRDVAFAAKLDPSGEWIETLSARDAKGVFRPILVTPTDEAVRLTAAKPRPTALGRPANGLYDAPPTLAFTKARIEPWTRGGKPAGQRIVMTREEAGAQIEKVISVPQEGRTLRVEQRVVFPRNGTLIRSFLSSYAFAPDRKRLSKGGKPDSTFSPGFRPKDDQVVGDHFFRAPVVSAQKGPLAALMLPDLDVLNDNRAIPMVLDLDAKNGLVDATLMTYGFADHRLNGHVYYRTDASMVRKAPKELFLAYDLILNAQAEPFGAYREALPLQWAKYGKPMFDRVLPQAMPFAEYAEYCYPRVFEEAYGANKLGWFEIEIEGQPCGGIPSGWGYTEGWVSWQAWFCQIRSAWGLRWWGKHLKKADWVDKADKMLNLALAAPMDRGACPTTYQSRQKTWKGCLITPSTDCYYDLTNMAWKGIWLLRFLEFEDCPRKEEILKQCREMAACMMRNQNADGSFPTWLTKEHKVVPILDHSAQTALPAWFLAEMAAESQVRAISNRTAVVLGGEDYRTSAFRASEFLVKNVVDQQLWYDFETFFSCSPKKCLQAGGKLDDVTMHDAHTLSPPQNTLCMQWTAEALMACERLIVPGSKVPPKVARQNEHEVLKSAVQRGVQANAFHRAALKALDIMALYQNVSNLSYRKTAYIFGGFGVQNSDGEYLDARQAQFGCTLADFGAKLGNRDYFERGVAATRASMTLINHPLHSQNGLYPNPNYPPGLQPENVAHGGSDHQAGRSGTDWGESSGLTAMAWLLHRYGPIYQADSWKVLVDGGTEGQKYFPKATPPLVDPAFDFSNWRLPGWTVEGDFAETPTFSDRMDFGISSGEGFIGTCEDGQGGYSDSYTGVITSPAFVVTKATLSLLVGGGSGEGVYVELIDEAGKRLFVERGHNSERMHAVAWDVSPHKGKPLRLRIVDKESGGWGHINVARVRVSD